MLNKIKPSVKEPLIVYTTGLIITVLAAIFFGIVGYPPVNTVSGSLGITTPSIYMLPVFFPYGMLLGEVIYLGIERKKRVFSLLLLIECIIIGLFSFIRYVVQIPFSGHSIILFFYIVHQCLTYKLRYPMRFIIGIIVLVITLIYKIFFWNDPLTFFLGALLGIILWIPEGIYIIKKDRDFLSN